MDYRDNMNEFTTILHAFASHARTVPDKTAVIEAETDRKCTYGELWAYVKAFSKRLTAEGVKHDFGDGYGTRVVVRCEQTIDLVVSSLAIQLAGGIFVPVEKNIAEARIIEIMEETDSKILIATKPPTGYDCIYIKLSDATREQDTEEDENIIFPPLDSLALILYTTGTTGKSKGVMVSHRATKARLLSFYSAFNHDDKQISLVASPLSHSGGWRRAFFILMFKCTLVLSDGNIFAGTFFLSIKKYNITIINIMSATLEMYLQKYREKLVEISDQIKYVTIGASLYTEKQITSLRSIFSKSKIILNYSATEVAGCYADHSDQKLASFCVGQPNPGTEIVFFDDQKNNIINTTSDSPGLFGFKSESRMSGYWKNPELTASVTRGDYVILSDLGYKGDDGLLYYLSRADDIIISGGYKIAPSEIEEAANSFVGIREAVCISVNDQIMGQVPKLFVVMEENIIFNFNDIQKFLRSKLEATRVPRYIEEISEIPKINNKINRKELKNI